MGDERAPGPDGFTAAFFKAHWDTVREDVVRAVREFYSTGRLLRSEGAFVRGRSLVDDVFLAQEIVRGYSVTRSSARYMLVVDLRKAYDTVSWEFLGAVLGASISLMFLLAG
ncbi:hypothetical protein LIER_09755 [Lithospermum erythrorhizon]|uniref:Reverse transcriptase n=1 Tax=Lithospermum erythrorhizon TaxID=34254 RepID=A0AAV3PGT0_LITER